MGVLSRIQTEIEKRSLSGGGWPSRTSNRAGIETSCYALMALNEHEGRARDQGIDLLLRTQNPDGSWPAFEGDDPEGCWTTALAAIALRFVGTSSEPVEKAERWLLTNKGREAHWFWKWKFRTVDRAVQFDPDKYGWPWFPGTVSWVIPTAFSLIVLKQSDTRPWAEPVLNRIDVGMDMLRDRACPQGGWNAGNGIVFGAALSPHIDTTAIALLALTHPGDSASAYGLKWLREACSDCRSAYSLAWSAIAFCVHRDTAVNRCVSGLHRVFAATGALSNVEILSLSAIAIKAAEGVSNPFEVVI